ncbi:MAG TPA: hypothetical protein VMT85_22080 [Thermoanaerobaculia bacterium]|nr:hypothetical protein [Thermoanaerobaculia bacterium]
MFLFTAMFLLAAHGSPAARAADCAELPGGDDPAVLELVTSARVVLLGEIHGTEQAPGLVGALACRAAGAGASTIVALELPPAEQERISRFLASDGGTAAQTALLAGELWQRSYQDGRSSRAMAGLLQTLRPLAQRGGLEVVLFDQQPAQGSRDEAMARRLAELIPSPLEGPVLVLTGNLHARVVAGVRWDPELVPMGLHLMRRRDDLEVVAIDLTSSGGTAWICQPDPDGCGKARLRGREGAEPGLSLSPVAEGFAYHGTFGLGSISASPPAVAEPPP